MTEQEKDILILKILGRPQSLTEDEVSFILSDQELLDIYNTSIKVKNAVSPSIKIDPAKEWELMRARIQASHKKDKTSSEGSSVFKNEEDKKSFIASFLRNLSKRPVAASIGTFLLFGALATGLLWNPKPIQNEGDLNGMAHAEPKTNSISLVSNTLDELSKANGEDLIDHSKEETKKKTSSNKEFVNSDTEKDRSNSAQGKPVPSNTLNRMFNLQ